MGLIHFVGPNATGTDYICSDIHGHFSLLEDLLAKVAFDKSKDRLFSLGDLIDRGPESDQVLDWLNQNWFFAIQGNHERMLINAVEQKSSHLFTQWMAWGGSWAENLDSGQLHDYCQALSALPVAIELQLQEGQRVALVHAELPDKCDWKDIVDLLELIDPDQIEQNLTVSDMLWNQSQIGRGVDGLLSIEPVKNIDHVFHGHKIVDQITTITNRTFMDLGSYLNDEIGLVNPSSFLEKVS